MTIFGTSSFGKIARYCLLAAIGFLLSPHLFASSISLEQSPTPAGTYSTSGFALCSSGTRSFAVKYNYGSNPSNSWGANPYKMTARLFKNGVEIGSRTFQGSKAWANLYFYNVGVVPAQYTALVEFRKRELTGWRIVEIVSSNGIAVTTAATPDFNVNGITAPSNGSPIVVCASHIRINAAATSCESNYWVGVQERDIGWNRTYLYEWGTWFAGQAPDNISLQQLATNSAAYWIAGPANRQGNTLFGGYLDAPTNSLERYYVVGVCTAEPSWQCKAAFVKVNGSC